MTTKNQHILYCYIVNYINEHGWAPSYEEMAGAVNQKSKSGIHRLVTGLEVHGLIRRKPEKARSIEVLRPPQRMDLPYLNGLLREIRESMLRRSKS